jgi:hypothetical protein
MSNRSSDPLLFAPKPAHNGTRTSRAAAESIDAREAETDRAVIWKLIKFTRLNGITSEAIARHTKINYDTVKARVHDLGREGKIRALKRTGLTSSNKPAFLFVDAEIIAAAQEQVELEAWPVPRKDWHEEAIKQERRAIDAEKRIEELERRLSARTESAA